MKLLTTRPRPIVVVPALGLTTALLLSCAYPVDNPLDPQYPLALAIQGPDTLYRLSDQAALTFSTTPSVTLPNGVVRWSSAQPQLLPVTPYGYIVFAKPEASPVSVDITLQVGAHTATKRVVVWQRPSRIVISSPQMTGDSILADGPTPLNVSARILDAGNSQVDLPYTLTFSDSTRIGVGPYSPIAALRPGRSYIVASGAGFRDSLLVHDREVPTGVAVLPCNYPFGDTGIRVGDSLQVTITFNVGGAPVDSVPTITGYRAIQVSSDNPPPPVTLTAGNWIKPLGSGVWEDGIEFRTWDGVTGVLEGCIRSSGP